MTRSRFRLRMDRAGGVEFRENWMLLTRANSARRFK